MRRSTFFIPTLKEVPKDAEIASHIYLLRAGLARQVVSGVYFFLPLGFRLLKNITDVISEEMERIGSVETLMPMLQPADLWMQTGRWYHYGKEMFRLHDRYERDFVLAPTHEEVCTALLKNEVHSYRQLPISMYQIHWKFRDELRPRFGLLRAREFLMKDAYTFDKDYDSLEISYQKMYSAYTAIFSRLALDFVSVEADTGSIGGSASREFMALAPIGEDTIVSCLQCDYAANIEKASVAPPASVSDKFENVQPLEYIDTPGITTIQEVAQFLSLSPARCIKSLAYHVNGSFVLVCVRGDREVSETKLSAYLGTQDIEFASEESTCEDFCSAIGSIGPYGLPKEVRVILDAELMSATDWVVGANKKDTHLLHFTPARDMILPFEVADIRVITQEDICPICGGELRFMQGIEVGHIFKLGTKYSEAMQAKFVNECGEDVPFVMGCYGIGVSRIIAALIEQNNDDKGIIFPFSVAPFHILIVSLDNSSEVTLFAESLYTMLNETKYTVLYDDRTERAGVKLNDADLIGIPIQILVGRKSLAQNVCEIKIRKTGETVHTSVKNLLETLDSIVNLL